MQLTQTTHSMTKDLVVENQQRLSNALANHRLNHKLFSLDISSPRCLLNKFTEPIIQGIDILACDICRNFINLMQA